MRVGNFFAIWFKPRETIRNIVEENPNLGLWVLSWVLGFLLLFNFFQIYSASIKMNFPILLAVLILAAPFAGYIYLSVASWVISTTGKWIKGKGSFKEVRAALAWSSTPLIISVLLWFLLLGVFGKSLFSNFPGGAILSHMQIYFLLGITLIQLGFSLWSMILYLNNLAEVQKFSIANAILNTIIGSLAVIFLIFFLWLLAIYIWAIFI